MKSLPANVLQRVTVVTLLALAIGFPAYAEGAANVEPIAVAEVHDGFAPWELQPGEFEWKPELSPHGARVVVSLPEQRAHVYRNGLRIGVSTISSGKPGNETPTGVFPILQKKRMHHSNLYNNAPMPFMQRLTWDGIALHAGRIPGEPASHGCLRLPLEFSKLLFDATESGMLVVIADEFSHDAEVVSPGERAAVDYLTGLALNAPQTTLKQSLLVDAFAEQ